MAKRTQEAPNQMQAPWAFEGNKFSKLRSETFKSDINVAWDLFWLLVCTNTSYATRRNAKQAISIHCKSLNTACLPNINKAKGFKFWFKAGAIAELQWTQSRKVQAEVKRHVSPVKCDAFRKQFDLCTWKRDAIGFNVFQFFTKMCFLGQTHCRNILEALYQTMFLGADTAYGLHSKMWSYLHPCVM